MDTLDGRCVTLTKEISAWKLAASRWRALCKRMMEPARFRFRGISDGDVWERDFVIAPTQRWRRMLQEDVSLSDWSTASYGPLTLALSPPPGVFLHFHLD